MRRWKVDKTKYLTASKQREDKANFNKRKFFYRISPNSNCSENDFQDEELCDSTLFGANNLQNGALNIIISYTDKLEESKNNNSCQKAPNNMVFGCLHSNVSSNSESKREVIKEKSENVSPEEIEDGKNIVPPNSPVEWSNPWPSEETNSEIEHEQLYPTPEEISPNPQSPVAESHEDWVEEGSSALNTGISIHTVPSTAIRSAMDMEALLFLSSSHTPASMSNSFDTN